MRRSLRWLLSWRFYLRLPKRGDAIFMGTFIVLLPPWYLLWMHRVPWTYYGMCSIAWISFLFIGARRSGGSRKPSASTGTKEPGTPTPGTGILAGCSSSSLRGTALAAWCALTGPVPVNSSTVRGASTDATATPGVSGVPVGRVV